MIQKSFGFRFCEWKKALTSRPSPEDEDGLLSILVHLVYKSWLKLELQSLIVKVCNDGMINDKQKYTTNMVISPLTDYSFSLSGLFAELVFHISLEKMLLTVRCAAAETDQQLHTCSNSQVALSWQRMFAMAILLVFVYALWWPFCWCSCKCN